MSVFSVSLGSIDCVHTSPNFRIIWHVSVFSVSIGSSDCVHTSLNFRITWHMQSHFWHQNCNRRQGAQPWISIARWFDKRIYWISHEFIQKLKRKRELRRKFFVLSLQIHNAILLDCDYTEYYTRLGPTFIRNPAFFIQSALSLQQICFICLLNILWNVFSSIFWIIYWQKNGQFEIGPINQFKPNVLPHTYLSMGEFQDYSRRTIWLNISIVSNS